MTGPTTHPSRRHRSLRRLTRDQAGVFSTAQAEALGVGYEEIRAHVAAGRWSRLHDGVYFMANTKPGGSSVRWAALLASGEGAVLSHDTAAEVYGFGRLHREPRVEVSIPESRREVAVPGVRVRRSRLLPAKATIHDGWPITTAADTVLDLIAEMRSPFAVVGLLTDACRSKSVSPHEVLRAMGRRRRQRHRQLVKDTVADVIGGVESNLEHKYLVRVERPHGLPVGRRQVRDRVDGVPIRKDVEYEEFATVVELDGRMGHEGSGRHRDSRRDNASTLRRKATLRYGHADLQVPCAVASEVAAVLRDRGWSGQATPCGPNCSAMR